MCGSYSLIRRGEYRFYYCLTNQGRFGMAYTHPSHRAMYLATRIETDSKNIHKNAQMWYRKEKGQVKSNRSPA
jgi:hypothetical protein